MNTLVHGAAMAILCVSCSDVPETTGLPSFGSAGAASPSGGTPAATAGSAGASGALSSTGGGIGQGGAGGTSGSPGGAGASGASGSAGSAPLDGHGLYDLQCKVCHEEQGAGGKLAPETQHPVRDYSTWVVRHGLPGLGFLKPMEVVGPDMLSDAQLNMIWDYLDKPPQPTTGQALYHDYCANCHGADGQGGPTTRPIVNELGKLKELVKNGSHPGDFGTRREYMPSLDPSRLSSAEVDLIYAYVDGL